MNISKVKLPISAVVVTCNESLRLESCLRSLDFCDEIIICDLFSDDGSADIGKKFATRFIQRPKVPFVEMLWGELFPMAKNDWILRFDPDQIIPQKLKKGICEAFVSRGNAAYINLPLIYFFLSKPIYFSVWGNIRQFPLFDRRHATFSGTVHTGLKLRNDKQFIDIQGYDDCAIEHYWVDSIPQMIKKHFRYLRFEGVSRFSRGERFSTKKFKLDCLESIVSNFKYAGCAKNGWRGYYLGIFHLLYIASTHSSLLVYQILHYLKFKR